MYREFFEELGTKVIETEYGWANYLYTGESCYVENVYIKPEFRKKGMASAIVDTIAKMAKENGCSNLLTTTNTKKDGVERSIQVILSYGFKYLRSDEGSIWYYKEL